MAETVDKKDVAPQCPDCSVPMTLRANRMSPQKFWGCPVFPECAKTFSLEYWGRPTVEAQKMVAMPKKGAKKQVVVDGNEEMDGDQRLRAVSKGPESELSWEMASAGQASSSTLRLSPEEVQLIIENRRKNK